MGSRLRCPRQHGRFRIHSDEADGCEGERSERDAAGWDKGSTGDSREARGEKGGGRVSGYPAGQARDGDGGGESGLGSGESAVFVCYGTGHKCDGREKYVDQASCKICSKLRDSLWLSS